MAKVLEVDEKNFDKEVLKAEGVVVIDFWATWCGPCKLLSPILEEVAEELAGKIKVVKINVDKGSKLANRYNIMSIPTLIVLKDGQIKDQIIGIQDKKTLLKRLKEVLK